MSNYTTPPNNRLVMSISNLTVTDDTPPATLTYYHQPSPPPSTVASNSIQIPSIVLYDDSLCPPDNDTLYGDVPPLCYTNAKPTVGGDQQQQKEEEHQPLEHDVKERRRRNKIASAKYRAKRNQENERLRKWIDDLRHQNALLVRTLNDIHCQGGSKSRRSGGKRLPPTEAAGTSDYAAHRWSTSLGNSTFSPF